MSFFCSKTSTESFSGRVKIKVFMWSTVSSLNFYITSFWSHCLSPPFSWLCSCSCPTRCSSSLPNIPLLKNLRLEISSLRYQYDSFNYFILTSNLMPTYEISLYKIEPSSLLLYFLYSTFIICPVSISLTLWRFSNKDNKRIRPWTPIL